VSPILGIWASQNYPRVTNSYESIATQNVSGSTTASVTFSSIPSTYKHLQIRYLARTNRTSSDGDYMRLRFNSDATNNYSTQHWLGGDGSGVVASYDGASGPGMYVERITSASQTANAFGVGVLDILDYTSTNKTKVLRFLTGADVNGTFNTYNVRMGSGMWLTSNTAVSSITIDVGVGPYFAANSQFALYGIKG
jgi:hypothetical protein